MKKYLFFAAGLYFLVTGVLPADEQITKGLSYELLSQGRWEETAYEEAVYVIKRIFQDDDGNYRFELAKEGPLGTGYIVLEGSTVKFEAIPGTEDDLSSEMKKFLSQTGSVWRGTSSFSFHEYIKLKPGGMVLYNYDKPIESGDELTINGVRTVVVMKMGKANQGSKVREGPSTSDKPVDLSKYRTFSQRGYKAGKTFIDKDDTVYVLCRTVEKEKIGGWNNYWYLIALPDHYMEAYVDADRAWTYGQFIDIMD